MIPTATSRTAFWLRLLALLSLTACGHSHGCSGFHFPSGHGLGHGSGGGFGHSLGHAAGTSFGASTHAVRAMADLRGAAQLVEHLAPLLFHARTTSVVVGGAVLGAPVADDIKVLAEDPALTAEIVASDTDVFWVDRSLSDVDSIVAVPVAGGGATTFYACPGDGVSTISSMALDSGYLYWVESLDPGRNETSYVKRMRVTGGAVEPVLVRRGRIKRIVVRSPLLYSVDESSARATSLSDGTEITLGPVLDSSQGPAIGADSRAIYWLGASRFTQTIMMAPTTSSPAVALSIRESAVTAMGVGGPSLYWVEYGGPNRESSVFAMDRRGGKPSRVFESILLVASASYGDALIAADDDGAFWMVEGSGPFNDGVIYHGARSTPPEVVVSGIGGPGGLALAGDWLVFTDMAQGLVVRVPR